MNLKHNFFCPPHRRSGGVYSLFFIVFKGAHGLVVPPRHWYFFPIEKGLGPRGYERYEMIKCLVGTTKH
jgi:hypothetical protein